MNGQVLEGEGFRLRPLMPEDAAVMHQVLVAEHRWGGFSVDPLEDVLAEFEDVGDLALDTTAVLTANNEFIAFGWIYPLSLQQPEYRIDFWSAIVPEYETAVNELLLAWMERRAQEIVAGLPDDGKPRWCTDWCYDDMPERIGLFKAWGYHLHHSELFMRRDLERPFPHDLSPEGVTFLPWTEERDGLMMQAFHAGFQDRWGERPLTTPEDWRRYYTGVTTFCPELSLIAMKDSKPVGMARVLINDVENKRNPHPEGEIGHIGVDPDYRRQGIASALMYQIMAGLKVRDLAYVMLTVDAKNERAIKTYGRVGFDTTKSYVRYRQDL